MTRQRNRSLLPSGRPDRWLHQQPAVEGHAREQKWPGTTMVSGILILVASFWTVGEVTLVAYGALFRWFAFLAFVGNLVPYDSSGLRLGMERLEWFLFNLLAVGPLVLSACMWLNYMCHGPEQFHVSRDVERKVEVKRHWIAYNELPGRPWSASGANADPGGRIFGVATGCLGYPVITGPVDVISDP